RSPTRSCATPAPSTASTATCGPRTTPRQPPTPGSARSTGSLATSRSPCPAPSPGRWGRWSECRSRGYREPQMSILDSVHSPADLRRLSYDDLDTLAGEIREFIVEAVTRSGGHLGSNLGAVELTLAVHRVFESLRDIILWDTGHQAYVHKIVTGRRDDFVTLRKAGGLSGYPNRAESEHDWIENSHASTIVSYAHGLATALEQRAEGAPDRHVVAIIGDGSMTGGMAFEGLNNLGHSGRKAIIILNDNGRSYAPTISKLGDSVARLRVSPLYLRQRARLD